jgi:tryptophan synthase alpha chain
MSRISSVFIKGRKTLIAYVTAGYPSAEATLETVPLLARLGCDIVELGVPFSDPLADGATIQKSSFQALHNGVTPGLCLELAGQIRKRTDIPLVFMSYFNPILACGVTRFLEQSARAGVDGLIVPDLPPEEGREIEREAKKNSIDLIYMLAPTSTLERIDIVAGRSTGFIYLVSVAGVTGTRDALPASLPSFVERVRARAKQPLCIGFGISTPEQAREAAGIADGVIVGSRLVQAMEGEGWIDRVSQFVSSLRLALDRP